MLTSQTAIFGILDSASNDSIFDNNKGFINHIQLVFKLYVYNSGVILGLNCIWLSDAALADLFFLTICFIKSSLNMQWS